MNTRRKLKPKLLKIFNKNEKITEIHLNYKITKTKIEIKIN